MKPKKGSHATIKNAATCNVMTEYPSQLLGDLFYCTNNVRTRKIIINHSAVFYVRFGFSKVTNYACAVVQYIIVIKTNPSTRMFI